MSITCYGNPLFQWDTGRSVTVTTAGATEAHFATVRSERAMVVELRDGKADIPSSLLMLGQAIAVWASDGEKTLESAVLKVHPRPKPDDYMHTEDEIKTWADVESWVREQLSRADEPGTKWYVGDGSPAIGGRVGDLYLDSETGTYYRYGEKE